MSSISRPLLLSLACYMLFFSIPGALQAQETEKAPEDLHQFFDDGGLAKRKNLVSTNLLSPLAGAIGLRYERAITGHLSVEMGVYKLLPFYLFELLIPVTAYVDQFQPVGGFGLSVSPRYFFLGEAPEYHYLGLRYGFRRHTTARDGYLAIHDFTIDYGYNLFISKYFMFCYDFGMGYRRMISLQGGKQSNGLPNRRETSGTIYAPISAGFGFMF